MKVRILPFLTTFAQLSARLKNFLGSWLLVLGIKEGLVECATVCVKSVVILRNMFCFYFFSPFFSKHNWLVENLDKLRNLGIVYSWKPSFKTEKTFTYLACKNLNRNSVSLEKASILLKYPTTFRQAGNWIGALNCDKSWFNITFELCFTVFTTSLTIGIFPNFLAILKNKIHASEFTSFLKFEHKSIHWKLEFAEEFRWPMISKIDNDK